MRAATKVLASVALGSMTFGFALGAAIGPKDAASEPASDAQLIPPLVVEYQDSVNSSRTGCQEGDPCWIPGADGYTCFVDANGVLQTYTADAILPEGNHLIFCPTP